MEGRRMTIPEHVGIRDTLRHLVAFLTQRNVELKLYKVYDRILTNPRQKVTV